MPKHPANATQNGKGTTASRLGSEPGWRRPGCSANAGSPRGSWSAWSPCWPSASWPSRSCSARRSQRARPHRRHERDGRRFFRPFGIDGSAVQVGKPDAKVTMDLWVDYSCPHCQEFEADSNDVITQRVASGVLKVATTHPDRDRVR